MKVQFELTIGENKFTLSEDVESHADFFKKLDFYSGLPKAGPNGETDLVLRHRVAKTKDGKPCAYFSIVSEKAGMEFKFGQSQTTVGSLFPKGWEAVYRANGAATDDTGDDQQQSIAPGQSVGLGAPAVAPQIMQQTTGVNVGPKVTASSGLGAAQAAPKPAAAQTAAPAAGAPPTQVQNQAKSVLSKFGI